MTVLLTCAGRRTSLLAAFQSAARERGGTVVAADLDPLAPTMLTADAAVEMPPVDAEAYPGALLDAVRTHNVDLVVPTIDPELPVLLDARSALADAGARAVISDASLLDVAADKWKTLQHAADAGFRTPASWRWEDLIADAAPESDAPSLRSEASSMLPDPVFVKPRRGSASDGARAVAQRRLATACASMDAPIVQEVVDAPEVTVDAFFDFDGTLIHYVPRLRLRTQAGESIQGRTLPDDAGPSYALGPWLREVLANVGRLGARGPITLQAFLTEKTPTLSEINPRFGGGFPLAHEAGARSPEWLLDLAGGASLAPRLGRYQPNLCMTRAYTEFYTTDC